MHFDGYIKELGKIKNVSAFEKLLSLLKQYDWAHDPCLLFNKGTNKGTDPAFNDSHCIQFTPSDLMCHIRNTFKQNYTQSTKEVIECADIITDELHQLFSDHYHLKSHIVAIIPGGKQIRHIDGIFYHGYARRLVVPLITTDRAVTNFDTVNYILDVGTVYEMNNRVPHWSENNDSELRVFLFADLIPPENLQIVKDHYNYIN